MANPIARIDSPLDWKSLWMSLRQRLQGLSLEAAIRGMGEDSDPEMRRSQGAYKAFLDAVATMDEMTTQARGGRSEEDKVRGTTPEPWKRSS